MSGRVAVIGGTGVGEELFGKDGDAVHVPTAHGLFRGKFVRWGSAEVLVVRRHASGHKSPPHRVPYGAIATGLRSLGVEFCLSTAAVGSLRADWAPGTMAICSDFIDRTCRRATLFNDTVRHTDFSTPFGPKTTDSLRKAAPAAAVEAIYVCVDGPRYETPAEVAHYREIGGDIVGMTVGTEAILMREAGIDYGCLAIVTNLATGIATHPLQHRDVELEMRAAAAIALTILEEAVDVLSTP